MYPILYENNETLFTSNGIGRLSDAVSCIVHEVRNGEYELTMEYPVNGKYFKEIQEWRILLVSHDTTGDLQPFDIYKISTPSHGLIEVKAHHISYRTNKIILVPSAAVGVTLQDFFNMWMHNDCIIGACPFSFYSDLTNEDTLNQPNFASIRTYLYGQDETGILACFGYDEGEYLLNRFNISFLRNRGQNLGKKFRTGKNVRLLTRETDIDDVIDAVVPYWLGKDPVSGDNTYVDLRDSGYIVEYSGTTPHAQQCTKQLDLSNVFEQPPTEEELEDAAQEWMRRHNNNTLHRESYIIQVSDETAKDLNDCNLCDIVTVEDEINEYRVQLKITEVTWNVLKERYDSVVVGDRRPLITETFKRQNQIYIQQIANNQEQISAVAKKKAQVEQTITPTTTTGAEKIGSVDGTDLYCPPSGGGVVEKNKKVGGSTTNKYGTLQQYDSSDVEKMEIFWNGMWSKNGGPLKIGGEVEITDGGTASVASNSKVKIHGSNIKIDADAVNSSVEIHGSKGDIDMSANEVDIGTEIVRTNYQGNIDTTAPAPTVKIGGRNLGPNHDKLSDVEINGRMYLNTSVDINGTDYYGFTVGELRYGGFKIYMSGGHMFVIYNGQEYEVNMTPV